MCRHRGAIVAPAVADARCCPAGARRREWTTWRLFSSFFHAEGSSLPGLRRRAQGGAGGGGDCEIARLRKRNRRGRNGRRGAGVRPHAERVESCRNTHASGDSLILARAVRTALDSFCSRLNLENVMEPHRDAPALGYRTGSSINLDAERGIRLLTNSRRAQRKKQWVSRGPETAAREPHKKTQNGERPQPRPRKTTAGSLLTLHRPAHLHTTHRPPRPPPPAPPGPRTQPKTEEPAPRPRPGEPRPRPGAPPPPMRDNTFTDDSRTSQSEEQQDSCGRETALKKPHTKKSQR